MSTPRRPTSAVAHDLTSSLSALLLGAQRCRQLVAAGQTDRAAAALERMEATTRAMAALVEELRPEREPGSDAQG